MPMQISCDLSSVSTETGLRWSFQAIVTVVYPAAQNPARRYVLLSDGRGTVGLTVWNPHVNSFSFNNVGKMAHFTKVSLTIHNNVKSISLNKESSVVLDDGVGHFAHTWWNSFTSQPSVPAILFHDLQDNTIGKAQQLEAHHRNFTFAANVSGILGSVHSELKMVRNEPKELLTMKIVDRTGVIVIRSWNHNQAQFESHVDSPIQLLRVRVTAFANTKVGELLDGTGTIVNSGSFDGAPDLIKFWQE